MSGSVAALLAAFISVFGLFAYGFITWVLKRLVSQLDELRTATQSLNTRITVIETGLTKNG